MWTGGLDGLYRDALASSHTMLTWVQVYASAAPDAVVLVDDLPIVSGTVTASLTSRVVRNLALTVDQSWYPLLATDPLAPYGSVITAWRGVEFGDGSRYLFPVFVGRIQTARVNSSGVCTITASDYAAEVIAYGFEAPENSNTHNTVLQEVRRLIDNAFPDATFGDSDSFGQPVAPQTWQNDRGSALDELSTSVGAYWYCLADGSFVLRKYPWTVSQAPLLTIADGEGGIVTDWEFSRNRAEVYNSVTVAGERLDGSAPVFYTARDTNPVSVTDFNGSFGRRSQQVYLHNPTSQGMAFSAANDALRRDIALVEYVQWEQVPDAALELGDAVLFQGSGHAPLVQVVDGFTLPLGVEGSMTVNARSLIVPVLH